MERALRISSGKARMENAWYRPVPDGRPFLPELFRGCRFWTGDMD